jgi:hypothetical protein
MSNATVNGTSGVYLAYTMFAADAGGHHHIAIASSPTGDQNDFSNTVILTDWTDVGQGPSLWNFNGHLYVAWQGQSSNDIFLGWFNGTSTLQGRTTVRNDSGVLQTTSARPSVAAYDGRLYVAWRGTDSGGHLNLISSADGVNFGTVTTFPDTIGGLTSPFFSVMTFQGQTQRLYVSWRGTARDNIYIGYYDYTKPSGTLNGHTALPEASAYSPALMSYDSQLWLGWIATDGALWVASSADGGTFADNGAPITFGPKGATSGPGFANFNGHLYIEWKDDTKPDAGAADCGLHEQPVR